MLFISIFRITRRSSTATRWTQLTLDIEHHQAPNTMDTNILNILNFINKSYQLSHPQNQHHQCWQYQPIERNKRLHSYHQSIQTAPKERKMIIDNWKEKKTHTQYSTRFALFLKQLDEQLLNLCLLYTNPWLNFFFHFFYERLATGLLLIANFYI